MNKPEFTGHRSVTYCPVPSRKLLNRIVKDFSVLSVEEVICLPSEKKGVRVKFVSECEKNKFFQAREEYWDISPIS